MSSRSSDAAEVHEMSWHETILRLTAGQPAPKGYEIKRIVGHVQQPTGGGTNYEDVYIVAARSV